MTSAHVVLNKRDSRSALGWVGAVWLAPGLGSLLYFLFGINRVQRRAQRIQRRRSRMKALHSSRAEAQPKEAITSPEIGHLGSLVELVGTVTKQKLLAGHIVQPLYKGDQAYPVMLQAIEEAQHTILLGMYIFNNDRAGGMFVVALADAMRRGVAVRVLIDEIGAYYTWNSIVGPLRKAGVPVARFLPKLLPRFFPYANICNHRKLLVVDSRVGFTGGMNITEEHCIGLLPDHPVHDLHFRIEGPVVARMQEVFIEDWEFCTGELLQDERWFPQIESRGSLLARGISSGPDEDLEKLRLVYLGAVSCAKSRVLIVTPYFLPDAALISALNIAALRGVEVDIVLPSVNDLRLVHWAAMAQIAQVLDHGCKVWLTPPPFDHSKLMLVDGIWTLFGSANWDPRSLRLNFEFNVECYDSALTTSLENVIREKLKHAQPLSLADVRRRPFLAKIRDGMARLLLPYL